MGPIKTEKQYREIVGRMDKLAAAAGAEENDELELLTILVMAYEAEHVPDVPMDPIEYLKASMENRGLTQSDLSKLLGSSSRAAEVLNGKRELSKTMIRTLSERWGLDANTLVGAQRHAA
jgi:HTH-type transcriptional regulator/antitoxin HigA